MTTRRALAVAALVALAAAACGSESERPALPVSLSSGGGERAASAMAEDDAGGSDAIGIPAYMDYELAADTSGLPDEGPAYEVKSDASESDVRDLAEALGLKNDPKKGERGEWYVAGEKGAVLIVEPMSGSPWYFVSEGGCAPDAPVSSDGEGAACGGTVSSGGVVVAEPAPSKEPAEGEVAPEDTPEGVGRDEPACKTQPDGSEICEAPAPVEPVRPENMPTKAEAEATARGLLEKLGVDLEEATVRVDDGFSAWYVLVEPMIDGLPVFGFGWSVTVGPENKIQSAGGHLGDPAKVADYPLMDVEKALEQLRGGVRAMTDLAVDCGEVPEGEGAGTQALCAEMEPQVQRITAVRLGLVFSPSYTEDGPGYLTPAWILTIEGGGEMPVNALPDEFVQQPEAEDRPEPEPLPADGGGTDGREPAQTEPAPPTAEG